MPTPSTDEKLPSRKRTALLYLAAFTVAAVAAWAFDLLLLVHLRLIANEAIVDDGKAPTLTVDAVTAVNAYPPRRLAGCLTFASPQMRSVILQALANRRPPGDPESWAGVLPVLLHLLPNCKVNHERRCIWEAIANLPALAAADVEPVFSFVDEQLSADQHWWFLSCRLLGMVARDQPQQRSRVLQTLERSMPRTQPSERLVTLSRLAELAPDSPEAAAAARSCSHAKGVLSVSSDVASIFQRQPSLADEFIAGDANQQALVIKAVWQSNLPRPLTTQQDAAMRAWLTTVRLASMQPKALALLNSKDDDVFNAAADFLRKWPEFAEPLFAAAKKNQGMRRIHALNSACDASHQPRGMGRERFLEDRLPELLSWLDDDDRDLRQAVLWQLPLVLPPDNNWLKRHRTGFDAPVVVAFRRLLDKYPGKHDDACLTVLAEATPHLDPRDVDRVAAALERQWIEMKNRFATTKFPPDPMSAAKRRLFDDIAKYPDRPAVRRTLDLYRSLIADGVIRQ